MHYPKALYAGEIYDKMLIERGENSCEVDHDEKAWDSKKMHDAVYDFMFVLLGCV